MRIQMLLGLLVVSSVAFAGGGVEASGGSLREVAPQTAFQYQCHMSYKEQVGFKDKESKSADFTLENDWATNTQSLYFMGANDDQTADFTLHLGFHYGPKKELLQHLSIAFNKRDADLKRSTANSVPVDVLGAKMHTGISYSEDEGPAEKFHQYSVTVDCTRSR